MTYKYCGTPDGPKSHIQDGEDCSYCKDWIKRGSPVITPESLAPKIVKAKPKISKAAPSPKKNPAPRKKYTTDISKPRPPRKIAEIAECGTLSGWHRHRDLEEKPCEKCRLEKNRYNRERYYATKANGHKPIGRIPDEREHGSTKGRDQHKRAGEEVCRPCKDAYNAYTRDLNARKRAEAKR